jgi:uncharacterized membrane protein
MGSLATTVAVYADLAAAEKDWDAIEAAARTSSVDLADSALVERDASGDVVSLHRHGHHGWGKGAVVGAVVGVLFPPSIVAGAVAGGLGGAFVGKISRCLGRGVIRDLGDVMDRGEIALVVVSSTDTVAVVDELLSGASHKLSRGDMPAEEVLTAMDAAGLNPR